MYTNQKETSLRPRHQSNINLEQSKLEDASIMSRLKHIQENKDKIKAKLSKLDHTYVPSHLEDAPSMQSRRRTNVDLLRRSNTPSNTSSSRDLDKVQFDRPKIDIYQNQKIQGDPMVNKLKNGGAKRMGINQLNKLRMDIHQKQEMLLKKKFIYRETEATAPEDLDKVMEMNQIELVEAFNNANLDIDEFRNPIPKELIMNELPKIRKNAEQRLKIFKSQSPTNKIQQTMKYNQRYLAQKNPKILQISRQILDQIINASVGYYEALSNKLQLHKLQQIPDSRKNDTRGLNDLIVHGVYSKILSKIMKDFHQETFQEVSQLQSLAKQKLFQIFGNSYKNYSPKWQNQIISSYEFKLHYQIRDDAESSSSKQEEEQSQLSEYQSLNSASDADSQMGKRKSKKSKKIQNPKSNKNKSSLRQPKQNKKSMEENAHDRTPTRPKDQSSPGKKNKVPIRKTAKDRYQSKVPHSSSSSLSQGSETSIQNPKSKNDKAKDMKPIQQQPEIEWDFLKMEKQFFQKVEVNFLQIIDRTYDSKKVLIQDGIYLLSNKHIKNIRQQIIHSIPYPKLLGFKKFNSYWLMYSQSELTVVHPWYTQKLGAQYGSRQDKITEKITHAQLFPVTTMLGSISSILVGFENGVIMKYNFNRDPINGKLAAQSFLEPVVPLRKLPEEPPLPKQYKNLLQIPKSSSQERHQYRQFFDFHTKKIIGIYFYSIVQFISIDVSMTCATWNCIDNDQTPVQTFIIDDCQSYFRIKKQAKSKPVNLKQDEQKLYQTYFKTKEGLSNQIFNDPEQGYAYYYPQSAKSGTDAQLWKVFYKNQKIHKIEQQSFVEKSNVPIALNACLWNSNLFILTSRQHPISPDYKTYRVVGWNIPNKRLKQVNYQIHLEKKQEPPCFIISDSIFQTNNAPFSCPVLFILSPGKVMMYSLVTGQFLGNVGDTSMMDDPLTFYHFTTAPNTAIVLVGDSGIHRMTFDDKNTNFAQQKYLRELKNHLTRFLN